MTHLHVFKIASIANFNENVQWMKFAIFLQAVNREWDNFLAGLRVDDTQVDLMGGSDEASNERSSFVVPTGRPLRNQKSRKACRSCEEDRKAGKAKVLRILRQRIGRKNQITVLLSPTRRRRGRRKGRLDSFWGTYESPTSFPGFSPTRPLLLRRAGRREPWERGSWESCTLWYVLGKQNYKQLFKVVLFHTTTEVFTTFESALSSYHFGTPFPSFAGILLLLLLLLLLFHFIIIFT